MHSWSHRIACLLLMLTAGFVRVGVGVVHASGPWRVVIAPRAGRAVAVDDRAGMSLRPFAAPAGGALAGVMIGHAPDSVAAAGAVALLAADPAVAWAEIEQRRETLAWQPTPRPMPVRGPIADPGTARFPSDPLFADTRQWGLANAGPSGIYGGTPGADIHARGAWERTTGANELRLALIDTGIDIGHPDLAAWLPDGSPRIISAADLTADALPVMADSFGHGTLVAGVMAALTNDGAHFDSAGVAGVCGGDGRGTVGCRLIPIRVTRGRGNGASSVDIARAILYAADRGARAVNLSMAGSAPSRLERLALAEALARGTVVVAAAGNRGFANGTAPQYPAAYAADGLCIQVGASDPWDQRALFSSYGPGLDLLAPGTDIWTTFMTYPSAAGASWGGYAVASGTSFSAPFVTGTVGLLCALRPALTDTDFQNVLRMSADDLDRPGPDERTGAGRLNAARALEMIGNDARLAHVTVAAQSWRMAGCDTLTLAEPGVPLLDALGRRAFAERWEVSARIVIPDSLADDARAWARVTGTGTLRDGFRLPWLTPHASVSRTGRRAFTVHGSVYRVIDARASTTDPEAAWLPARPERVTFPVTLLGPRRTERSARTRLPIALAHDPARGPVVFTGAPGERIEVFDAAGRRLLTRDVPVSGRLTWVPRDAGGRPLRSGIYFVRVAGRTPARLVLMR